jgi:hypothetical protein
MMLRRFIALIALATLAAGAARAETYKWVDERGVVNYSNSPAPGKTSVLGLLPDRISTYQSAPLPRVAPSAGPDYEWLQRQRIMMQMAAAKPQLPADCGYRVDCRDPYLTSFGYPLVPVFVARPQRSFRARALRSASFH